MTHCWICGASDLQVPNTKDIEERVRNEYLWDDPDEEENR